MKSRCSRLAGITDIYSEVGKFCTSVHKIYLFVWERFQHTEGSISKLEEMIEKIEDQNDESFIKILPVLALYWSQVKNGTFMNNLPPVEQTGIEA